LLLVNTGAADFHGKSWRLAPEGEAKLGEEKVVIVDANQKIGARNDMLVWTGKKSSVE